MEQVFIRRGEQSLAAHSWLKEREVNFVSAPLHFIKSSSRPDVMLFEVETPALAVELALRFSE